MARQEISEIALQDKETNGSSFLTTLPAAVYMKPWGLELLVKEFALANSTEFGETIFCWKEEVLKWAYSHFYVYILPLRIAASCRIVVLLTKGDSKKRI